MQRHRYNEMRVVIRGDPAESFQSQKCQWITQVGALIIFEGMDQLANRAFIEKMCPGGVISGRVDNTGSAAVIASRTDKRNSAEGTGRRRNERQPLTAGRADMERFGIQNKGMADVADRRQNHVKQRAAKLRDMAHLEAEFGIDDQNMKIGHAWFAINDCCYPAKPLRRIAVAAKTGR